MSCRENRGRRYYLKMARAKRVPAAADGSPEATEGPASPLAALVSKDGPAEQAEKADRPEAVEASSGTPAEEARHADAVTGSTAALHPDPHMDPQMNPHTNPHTDPHMHPYGYAFAPGPYTQAPFAPYPPGPYYAPPVDPDQEYYMKYYSQLAATSSQAPGQSYEQQRSFNQMSHYFDTSKFSTSQPGLAVQQQREEVQRKKPTKKELEFFRKRKEEKKKLKNKWLFE